MHHQRCVPRAEHPVYNMVMSDVTVSCTSLEKDRRVGVAVLSGLSSIYICTLNFSLYRGCFERPCIWCLWHVTESRWYCMSFFYLFNWRLITLQYCSGFCHTLTGKQPRCPLADEWIRKLWFIYIMEYYSAIKKNAFESVLMNCMKPII